MVSLIFFELSVDMTYVKIWKKIRELLEKVTKLLHYILYIEIRRSEIVPVPSKVGFGVLAY